MVCNAENNNLRDKINAKFTYKYMIEKGQAKGHFNENYFLMNYIFLDSEFRSHFSNIHNSWIKYEKSYN